MQNSRLDLSRAHGLEYDGAKVISLLFLPGKNRKSTFFSVAFSYLHRNMEMTVEIDAYYAYLLNHVSLKKAAIFFEMTRPCFITFGID